jgi:hypothetical protein
MYTTDSELASSAARWYIFKPKIQIWRVLQWNMLVYFMSIWYILQTFAIFYGHLVYFLVIWYIFPILVCCSKKNLATLLASFSGENDSRTHEVANCLQCFNSASSDFELDLRIGPSLILKFGWHRKLCFRKMVAWAIYLHMYWYDNGFYLLSRWVRKT